MIVGVAQSPSTLALIEQAKNEPSKAIARLRQQQDAFTEQVDEGRRRQMVELVEALRTGEK